jgi:hypothetical protein
METIKEQIQLGFKGKIIAFFLILIAVYSLVWEITEPLTINWISDNPIKWRYLLLSITIIFTILAFIFLFPKKLKENFGFGPTDTNIETSFISTGNPEVTIELDGFNGKIANLNSNVDNDEMDWHINPSANRAKFVSMIYLPIGKFYFYLRIKLVSKEKTEEKFGWIRFEPTLSIPDQYYDNVNEMAYPINAINYNNFFKANIDIQKAVKDTFGQGGWNYGKVVSFRIRGNGKLKEISFR